MDEFYHRLSITWGCLTYDSMAAVDHWDEGGCIQILCTMLYSTIQKYLKR